MLLGSSSTLLDPADPMKLKLSVPSRVMTKSTIPRYEESLISPMWLSGVSHLRDNQSNSVCSEEAKLARFRFNRPQKVDDVRLANDGDRSLSSTTAERYPMLLKRTSVSESPLPEKILRKDESHDKAVRCGVCKAPFNDNLGFMDHIENAHMSSATSKTNKNRNETSQNQQQANDRGTIEVSSDDEVVEIKELEIIKVKKKIGSASRLQSRTKSFARNAEPISRTRLIEPNLLAACSYGNFEDRISVPPVNVTEQESHLSVANSAIANSFTNDDHLFRDGVQSPCLKKSGIITGCQLMVDPHELEGNVPGSMLANDQIDKVIPNPQNSGGCQKDDPAKFAVMLTKRFGNEESILELRQGTAKILQQTDEAITFETPRPPSTFGQKNCYVSLSVPAEDFSAWVKCSLCEREFHNNHALLEHVDDHLLSNDPSDEEVHLNLTSETHKIETELAQRYDHLSKLLTEAALETLPSPEIPGLTEISSAFVVCDLCGETCLDSTCLQLHVLIDHSSSTEQEEKVPVAPEPVVKKRGRPRKYPLSNPYQSDADQFGEIVIFDCPNCEARFFDDQLLREHNDDVHTPKPPIIFDEICVMRNNQATLTPPPETETKIEPQEGQVENAVFDLTEMSPLKDNYKRVIKPCSVILRRLYSGSVETTDVQNAQTSQNKSMFHINPVIQSTGTHQNAQLYQSTQPSPSQTPQNMNVTQVSTRKRKDTQASQIMQANQSVWMSQNSRVPLENNEQRAFDLVRALSEAQNVSKTEIVGSINEQKEATARKETFPPSSSSVASAGKDKPIERDLANDQTERPTLRLVPISRLLSKSVLKEPNNETTSNTLHTQPKKSGQSCLKQVSAKIVEISTPTRSGAAAAFVTKPLSVVLTKLSVEEVHRLSGSFKSDTPSLPASQISESRIHNFAPPDNGTQKIYSDMKSFLQSLQSLNKSMKVEDSNIRCGECSRIFSDHAKLLFHIEDVHRRK